MYDVATEEFKPFAIAFCRDRIGGVYRNNSPEMKQYNREVRESE